MNSNSISFFFQFVETSRLRHVCCCYCVCMLLFEAKKGERKENGKIEKVKKSKWESEEWTESVGIL